MHKSAVIALLVLVAVPLAPTAAPATPGSGTATIAPSGDVQVATAGMWTITYTAAEPFSDGTF